MTLFSRSCFPQFFVIGFLIHITMLRQASAEPASRIANHRQGASRKLAQGTTNVDVNIPGVAASKGPVPPFPPPSPPSPPAPPPGQVNTNVEVSPAGQGGVKVVVNTPPVPGPQTAVNVNVPGITSVIVGPPGG